MEREANPEYVDSNGKLVKGKGVRAIKRRMIPNLSLLKLCSESIGESTANLNSGTGCSLTATANLEADTEGSYALRCLVTDQYGRRVFSFKSKQRFQNRPEGVTIYATGTEEWRGAPCAYSMYWAIKVAVEAVQKEMPNIESIIYSDVAVLLRAGKYTLNPSGITTRLRKLWKTAETLAHIKECLEPHLYRLSYYEKLGFEFDDPAWRKTIDAIAVDLFAMLEAAGKAKAARQNGTRQSVEEIYWNSLFRGKDYAEWPLFTGIILERMDTEFRGDLVHIANGEVPTKGV